MAGVSIAGISGDTRNLEQELMAPVTNSTGYYKEHTYSTGVLSQVGFYDSASKTTLIYTVTYTYNSLENITRMVILRNSDSRSLQVDYTYDSNEQYLLNVTRTVS